MRQEALDDRAMAQFPCPGQRGGAIAVNDVDVGPTVDQQFHHVVEALADRKQQCRRRNALRGGRAKRALVTPAFEVGISSAGLKLPTTCLLLSIACFPEYREPGAGIAVARRQNAKPTSVQETQPRFLINV